MRLSTLLCVLLAVCALSFRATAEEKAPVAAVAAVETSVGGTVAVAEDGAVTLTTADKVAHKVSGAAAAAVKALAGKTVKATGVVSKDGIAVSKVEEVVAPAAK